MKRLFFCSVLISSYCVVHAQGAWTQRTDFPGYKRQNAAAFTIGSKGYIACGDTTSVSAYFLKDLWEWNQSTNTWIRKADMPAAAPARGGAVGFSIGNKGYIATGSIIGGISFLNDLWEWDQATDTWTQKANLPASKRAYAVGFAIGNKGYVGTGLTETGVISNDCWEWDQATDTWMQINNIPVARYSAVGLSMGAKGYVASGDSSGFLRYDFWEWNQSSDSWSQKANYPMALWGDAGFAINNKIYIGTGFNGFSAVDDFFSWDSLSNTWSALAAVAAFGGGPTFGASSFSIGDYGYVLPLSTTGQFWEYSPTVNIKENSNENTTIKIWPNPFREKLYISFEKIFKTNRSFIFTIYNTFGQKVIRTMLTGTISIQTMDLPLSSGIYYYTIQDNEFNIIAQGKLVSITN